jgi:hypothetical protein
VSEAKYRGLERLQEAAARIAPHVEKGGLSYSLGDDGYSMRVRIPGTYDDIWAKGSTAEVCIADMTQQIAKMRAWSAAVHRALIGGVEL